MSRVFKIQNTEKIIPNEICENTHFHKKLIQETKPNQIESYNVLNGTAGSYKHRKKPQENQLI